MRTRCIFGCAQEDRGTILLPYFAMLLHRKKPEQSELCSGNVADRVGFEPTSRLRDYLISSLFNHYDFCVFFVSLSGCFVRPKP